MNPVMMRRQVQTEERMASLPIKWLKLVISPNAATYRAIMTEADWAGVAISLLVWAAGVGMVFVIFNLLLFGGGFFSNNMGEGFKAAGRVVFQFVLGVALTYGFATFVFKGKGQLLPLAYLVALYSVLLGITYAVLAVLVVHNATLFGLVGLVFWVAVIFYLSVALQAVFGFEQRAALFCAAATIALPLLGALLLLLGNYAVPGLIMGFSY